LIDLGYAYIYISENIAKKLEISLRLIKEPFEVFNVDGSQSGHKPIMNYVNITLDTEGHKEQIEVVVTTLDLVNMFLEYDWLTHHNPKID
ncbi:hypothetical protein AN958_02293, partial [Leucoagaricus sp. SymC.cos]